MRFLVLRRADINETHPKYDLDVYMEWCKLLDAIAQITFLDVADENENDLECYLRKKINVGKEIPFPAPSQTSWEAPQKKNPMHLFDLEIKNWHIRVCVQKVCESVPLLGAQHEWAVLVGARYDFGDSDIFMNNETKRLKEDFASMNQDMVDCVDQYAYEGIVLEMYARWVHPFSSSFSSFSSSFSSFSSSKRQYKEWNPAYAPHRYDFLLQSPGDEIPRALFKTFPELLEPCTCWIADESKNKLVWNEEKMGPFVDQKYFIHDDSENSSSYCSESESESQKESEWERDDCRDHPNDFAPCVSRCHVCKALWACTKKTRLDKHLSWLFILSQIRRITINKRNLELLQGCDAVRQDALRQLYENTLTNSVGWAVWHPSKDLFFELCVCFPHYFSTMWNIKYFEIPVSASKEIKVQIYSCLRAPRQEFKNDSFSFEMEGDPTDYSGSIKCPVPGPISGPVPGPVAKRVLVIITPPVGVLKAEEHLIKTKVESAKQKAVEYMLPYLQKHSLALPVLSNAALVHF